MESQIFSLHWLGYASLIVCGANGLLKIFTFAIDGMYIIYTTMLKCLKTNILLLFDSFLYSWDSYGRTFCITSQ